MSIPSGEFDTRRPDDQDEEEKVVTHHSVVNYEENVRMEEETAPSPSSDLLVLDDEEEEGEVHAPPVGIRPRHYPSVPAPSSVRAPKPLSNSPAVTGKLKQHLKKKSSLSSFLSSSSKKSSPSSKEGNSPASPTLSSHEETASTNDNEGYHNNEQQRTNSQSSHQQQHSISAASLVVCGVDGTVYTLDAYTGQLRGMFTSGPALVFSPSPEEDDGTVVDKNNDVVHNNNGASEEHGNGDASNAITSNVSPSWKERVVPGLDGRLYSLFEMVGDTTEEVGPDNEYDFEKCHASDGGEHDELNEVCDSRTFHDASSNGNNDGSVIPRFGSYQLTPLPISAMDVVDSPISTCRPDSDTQQKQCGIIVGSKKTTIYAINPTTGKVRWTQDPQGGVGGRGFTRHPPKNSASRGQTVLLQREDYAVRHLDTDGGDEVWKVELGRFSALDFDVGANSRSGNSGGRSSAGQETSSDDDMFGGGETAAGGDHVVGGRRRGAAAAAATAASKDKKKPSVPPILGGRKKTSLHDFDSGYGGDHQHTGGRKESLFDKDEFDHDHSAHFRGFPSIAFGEDGTSLMAVDGISGELLWKRRIESVVAAVYGVGKESSWIRLDVIDESDVFTHGHVSGLLPSSSSPSPENGGLVPYGAGQMESGKLHRLGRHQSNLFVSSKFDPSVGYDAHPLAESGVENAPYADGLDSPLPSHVNGHEFHLVEDRIFAMNPSELTMDDVTHSNSHRTEHGLYLTWSMIAAIAMIMLSLVVFIARVVILRQKRKWENTPSLEPMTAPSSSEDGRDQLLSLGGVSLPPPARNHTFTTAGDIWLKKDLPVNKNSTLFSRSFSLGAMGSHSMEPPVSNENAVMPFISERDGATLPLLALSTTAAPQLGLGNGSRPPSIVATTMGGSPRPSTVATNMSPMKRSLTLPAEASPPDVKSRHGVDNIDGIPLVRYSRYTSEFTEILPLGRGGFGTVFRCQNALDGREYAIKKIKIMSQLSMDGKVTKHFSQKLHRVLREVKCLALLDHPNIVRYYTAWLEVDEGNQNEDDDTNATSSMFDRKSQGIFSSSIFTGFGSNSRTTQTSFTPKINIHQRPAKGFLGSYNPLGWNNFGSSFRLDESASGASSFGDQQVHSPKNVAMCEEEEDDLGFTWERSNDDTAEPSVNAEKQPSRKLQEDLAKEEDSQSSSGISSVDSEESTMDMSKGSPSRSVTQSKSDAKKTVKFPEPNNDTDCKKQITEVRHILFIQMQLCSVQTLADFLADRQARSGSVSQSSNSGYAVDIPLALRLFGQICGGVKYVQKQGLIHRDLKPQNCFIDDAGNVKVGDFGLSRESSTAGGITDFDENGKDEIGHDDSFAPIDISDAENTAGVGTRAYASPEQMRGSNYDASTDVFSLGLILFELCYPMYTSMERYTEFSGIQKGHFPSYWNSHVKPAFPTMHDLLVQMVSYSASKRPSVDAVSDHIDSLLREYSVQSLDKSWGKKGALLLRVEAEEKEGILVHAMKLIKDAAPNSTILQYGLRGQASRAIMEFALEIDDSEKNVSVENISSRLQDHDMTARRIANSE
mmetsp:Transcript_4749/g.10776  ORF Transcript_4749/g.10776 Transcript_4749/m.10776 type:complete len:1553 (+) Transcript_4749:165-4823(+)